MTPFYFGPSGRRLYGVYHAAAPGKPARGGVVVAAPFGHEAIRVHRFNRLLADRLSRQGIPVLRFDYFGTGDSAGSDEDANMDQWAADLREAHRELLRRIGDLPVTWFGERLGASVALRAAAQSFPRVRRLVLWEPVFDGRAYLAELGMAQVDELDLAFCIPDARWRRAIEQDPLAFSNESLGFAIAPAFRDQILALRPDEQDPSIPCPVTVIARGQDWAAGQWCSAAKAHVQGDLRHVPFEHSLIWTSNPFANNEVAPAAALQQMLGELT
ncbi:alpha/beta hydrolase [Variovorax dokdonensis]|uniref:Alpha/beta hydrolase n=1 Tax=Variovorax dokdonensis TaxID=344883 RepID=A0ABT7N5H1_9BURK|nr:alpha/beta fold hydrolase [Variovorax dokdonensis]MDM0043199.1 alpha/beta hydrolase [Variovorax dokdonensis]